MKFLHTMGRVSDVDDSLDFYCNKLGMVEKRRHESPEGKFTLIFLAAPETPEAELELTFNWEPEAYGEGRNFGHLAFAVDDIYETCQRLADQGCQLSLDDFATGSFSLSFLRSRSTSARATALSCWPCAAMRRRWCAQRSGWARAST